MKGINLSFSEMPRCKTTTFLCALLAGLLLSVTGCSERKSGTATDMSGNRYRTVSIGKQVWMAENLDVTCYRNGDPIPEVRDPKAWSELTTGAWCWYENKDEYGKRYGRLYNWYAVSDPRGLAPEGWRVATDDDWEKLAEALGGELVAGGALKDARAWKSSEGTTRRSDFALLPSGARRETDGRFLLLGEYSRLWSATESSSEKAWSRGVGYFDMALRRGEANKRLGFAVRCLKE